MQFETYKEANKLEGISTSKQKSGGKRPPETMQCSQNEALERFHDRTTCFQGFLLAYFPYPSKENTSLFSDLP